MRTLDAKTAKMATRTVEEMLLGLIFSYGIEGRDKGRRYIFAMEDT